VIHRVHTKFMTCKPKGFFVPELRLRRHVVQITGCLWNLNTFRLCPGFDQDRVNFHRNPGRSTARKADPTWPNRAGYSIPCAVMLGSGGGELAVGTHSRLGSTQWRRCGRAALWVVWFVLCFPLIRIGVVTVPFAVLLNCPYPDPPVSAYFFPFSSAPQRGEGWPHGAFVAGRSQIITH